MAEKKSDFVVQDRRRFTEEGEVNREVPARDDVSAPRAASVHAEVVDEQPEVPVAPTEAEQHEQHGHYRSASKDIDDILDQADAKRPKSFEANFESLILSLYMQAMVQMGVPVREGDPPQPPDVVGARHTIDIIALLQEKTKGNLSEREKGVLQNSLFELRMTFVELTKAITTTGAGSREPGSKR